MEATLLKILCMVILFIILSTCGLIPVVAVWKSKITNFSEITSTLISLCNCLAGGVFLGMCFLGLFPYVREKFDEILVELNVKTSFPVAEFVVILSFILFLFIEQTLLVFRGNKESCDISGGNISLKMSDIEDSDFRENRKKCADESRIRLLESESPDRECFDGKSKEETVNPLTSSSPCLSTKKTSALGQQCGNFNSSRAISSLGGHNHCDLVYVFQKDSSMRNLIFLFAVSIHSLFEGMALGLQTDTVKILHLFLAVLIHESLVAFALGVNVAKYNLGLLTSLKYIVLVTGSIPVGIIIGILCGTATGLYGKIISGLFQGLAAGIFIHVTFMELLPEEFLSHKNRIYKVLFFFLGFLCMAIVNFSLSEHH
ncbi:zinc transporter ZIP3-like [Ischnura elegans]|uniref:zinc transporter ZIP3-like n=1 Tax=Ischnura elegans TaxID=197161 RepID=UPI001ED899E8|nr:zinc transporter ZIP3-like [Ischnura elegans]